MSPLPLKKGLILTDNVWKFEIKNEVTVTGSSGQILFQAAKNDGADLGSDAISPFELAVIRFKGLAPSAGTPLTFVTTGVTITQARLGEK